MDITKRVSAVRITGRVFTLIGGGFLVMGAALWYFLRNTEGWLVGPIFLAVGGIFLLIGILLLTEDAKHRHRLARLVESGRYVWGEVVSLEPDRRIRINDENPFYAVLRYTDPFGRVTVFRSISSMELRHRDDLVGRQVKVYIGADTAKDYAVDLDSLFR